MIAAVVLAKLDYYTRDSDSVLYADLSAQIAERPFRQWIAPRWVGEDLFREHPVGIFLLPALLIWLGFPAMQAAYVVNCVYQIATLVLIAHLARLLTEKREAHSLLWFLQLLPISFVYRIRANHEQAVLLFLLLALYATERSQRNPFFAILTAAALIFMMLVKGIFVAFGVFACALWLFLRSRMEKSRTAYVGFAVAVLAVLGIAFAYEITYRDVTGESFAFIYLKRWLARSQLQEGWLVIPQKLYNLLWYTGVMIWYAFPWSLFAIVTLYKERRWIRQNLRQSRTSREIIGVLFVLGIITAYLAAFSLFDHRASRYLFPVYYILAAFGVIAALRWKRMQRFVEWTDRWHPWLPAALWIFLFAAHIIAGRL